MNPRRFLILCVLAGPAGLLLVFSMAALVFMISGSFTKPTVYEEWLDVTNFWTFLGGLLFAAGASILSFGAMYLLYRWTIKDDAEKSPVTE